MTRKEAVEVRMPNIGKYKNKRLAEIQNDTRYLRWFQNNVYDYPTYNIVMEALSIILAKDIAAHGGVRMGSLQPTDYSTKQSKPVIKTPNPLTKNQKKRLARDEKKKKLRPFTTNDKASAPLSESPLKHFRKPTTEF